MEAVNYSFEQVGRLLDMPETVLARLCHVFRLPAGAFTANSRVLVRGDAPFTQADLDRLSVIHQAVMAGHPLKTIQQRFARQDAVAKRSALPAQPNFLSVLSQQAHQSKPVVVSPPLHQPLSKDSSLPETSAMSVPSETVLASLASRIQRPVAASKVYPDPAAFSSSAPLSKPVPLSDGEENTGASQDEALKALFPRMLHPKTPFFEHKGEIKGAAQLSSRPVCPPQTAPTDFVGFPALPTSEKTSMPMPFPLPPSDLQQAFRRRTQPPQCANIQDSFKAF